MSKMHPQMAFSQPEGIPDNLIIWQDENSGIASLVNAAHEIANGRKVTFALCTRKGTLIPEIVKIVTLGTDGQSARYCGDNDDPDGAGSHALIPSWYEYSMSETHIAIALARAFSSFDCYFRLASC